MFPYYSRFFILLARRMPAHTAYQIWSEVML